MGAGIVSFGVYVPRYRIKREDIARAWGGRALGESSVAYRNEDPATMAAEAAYNALHSSAIEAQHIDALYLASESAPYIEHSLARAIADTLRMKPEADLADFSTSPRAGATALKSCLDAVRSGRIRHGLVAIADSRPVSAGSDEELSFGSGAAAFLVGDTGVIAEVEDSYTWASYLVDSWRGAGADSVRSHDPRFTREFGYSRHCMEAATGLLKKLVRSSEDYSHVVLQYYPDEKTMRALAGTLGITPAQLESGSVGSVTGDTGAASVPLGLAAVLEKAKGGEKVLLVFYGSAAGEAVSLQVAGDIEKRRRAGPSLDTYLNSKEYVDYLALAKMRGLLHKDEAAGKSWVSPLSPSWYRDGAAIRRLAGAKCTNCGYLNFPPTLRRICVRCGNTRFEEVLRSRQGKVHTFCVNIYNAPGMESPLPVIVGDMEDGSRFRALGTEMKTDQIKIGQPVQLAWRKISSEEGVNAYAWVFRPLR